MNNLHGPIEKFFRDRGTHLAAMIAYFALLSLVPLIFLALALLGIFGRADESSYLVTELQALFPSPTRVMGVSPCAMVRSSSELGDVVGDGCYAAILRSRADPVRARGKTSDRPAAPWCAGWSRSG